MRYIPPLLALVAACAFVTNARGEENTDTLARKLSNPISSLISVPFQLNSDFGAASDGEGEIYTLNVQPVIPIRINDDWNLISRTVLPLTARENVFPSDDSVSGISDTLQSFFFSPQEPGPHGLIWGVGPAFLLPTATDDRIGTEKWGIGPTAVALVQKQHWTVGVLANHIWSVAGDDDRDDVSASFVQPFAAYSLGHGRTISGNIEATYDWQTDQLTAPATLSFSQIIPIGHQLISVQIGGRYYLDGPDNAPDWGLRTTLTFLFPRR